MAIVSNFKQSLRRLFLIALCIGATVWACLALVERCEQAARQDSALVLLPPVLLLRHFAPAAYSTADLFRGR